MISTPLKFTDKKDGRKVLACQIQDEEKSIVTIPANKFWESTSTDETGIWPEKEFNERFVRG